MGQGKWKQLEDKPMKRTPKPVFFIVALLILALTYTSFFGVYRYYGDRKDTIIRGASDIRFGTDIRGGVNVTFGPAEDVDATAKQMEKLKDVMAQRLISNNITDYEAYTDVTNQQVIIQFPWKTGESDYDSAAAIEELGKTAQLEFYLDETESSGLPTKKPEGSPILTGNDVETADPGFVPKKTTPLW